MASLYDPLKVEKDGDNWYAVIPRGVEKVERVKFRSSVDAHEFANIPLLLAKYPTANDVRELHQLNELRRAKSVLEPFGASEPIYRDIQRLIDDSSEKFADEEI